MDVNNEGFFEPVEQEPVALQMDVIVGNLVREGINKHRARELAEHFIKHTTPPQRTWVGLPESAFAGMTLQQVTAMKYAEQILKDQNT
jgi:alpha-D-ribose 1-methylphosphonate 5-triphosphate synthase subunit PhnL